MVSVDPFESTPPQRPPFCGTAPCVQNFRLSKQMLASLNIFISIHVSISKGMEVNPPPRGKGMTQCFVLLFFFFCSYCRSHADTSRTTHGQIISSRRVFFFSSFFFMFGCQSKWFVEILENLYQVIIGVKKKIWLKKKLKGKEYWMTILMAEILGQIFQCKPVLKERKQIYSKMLFFLTKNRGTKRQKAQIIRVVSFRSLPVCVALPSAALTMFDEELRKALLALLQTPTNRAKTCLACFWLYRSPLLCV